MGRWQREAMTEGLLAQRRRPSTTRFQRAVSLPMASAQGGSYLSEYLTHSAADKKSLTSAMRRSEEHTSELQSLMRISYAVFCLKKKTPHTQTNTTHKSTHEPSKPIEYSTTT